ncbi:MAG: glucose-1-phosphate adenylyltransferase, partial [Candidatus Saccharimonas sp.]|nr:glucose-1-phosphate adenylyltransferase [Planctomycetaceae bacterium]
GAYRIIDFALSNCVNSGLAQVLLLTQYKSLSLERHIESGWRHLFQRELGASLDILPPQHRVTEEWYRGTADAVYQNIYSIEQFQPDQVLILAGDHIYTMDYREMLRFHNETGADVTVGALPVPVDEAARQFGVIQVNSSLRVVGFQEKPKHPITLPGEPESTLASMGIYIFSTQVLKDLLCHNANQADCGHDFGHDILPVVLRDRLVCAFQFQTPGSGAAAYWRDVGTIDAYFEANQDLLRHDAPLDLRNTAWPIRTFKPNLPPPVFVSAEDRQSPSHICDSIVCAGSVIVDASVTDSVIGYNARLGPGSSVEGCVLFHGTELGPDVRLRRTILDKYVTLGRGTRIGFDADEDIARGFTISPNGITVVPQGTAIPDA